MGNPTNPLVRLLRRWSLQQGAALHQMTERKTAGQRIAGFSKSERADAKFLLLAIAPFALVMGSDLAGWERGALWHVWFWMSAVWAVVMAGIGCAAYWRALLRSRQSKE